MGPCTSFDPLVELVRLAVCYQFERNHRVRLLVRIGFRRVFQLAIEYRRSDRGHAQDQPRDWLYRAGYIVRGKSCASISYLKKP
jgi:hypothetical protein